MVNQSQHYTKWGRAFLLKAGTRQEHPHMPCVYNNEVLHGAIRKEKQVKGVQTKNENLEYLQTYKSDPRDQKTPRTDGHFKQNGQIQN